MPWKQALGWLDLWGQQGDRSSHPSTKGEPTWTQGSEGYQITAYYKDKVQSQITLKWSCQVIKEEYCSIQGCNFLSKRYIHYHFLDELRDAGLWWSLAVMTIFSAVETPVSMFSPGSVPSSSSLPIEKLSSIPGSLDVALSMNTGGLQPLWLLCGVHGNTDIDDRLGIHECFKWQSRTNFYRYKLGSLHIQVSSIALGFGLATNLEAP